MGNTDNSLVRDFRENPITFEELTHCRWYAIANDTIGGWDIATVNIPDSRRNAQLGQYEIGCFLTREVAEHITEVHNQWWDAAVWGSYFDNIELSVYKDYVDELDLTEDDWFDYDEPYETT